MGMQFRPLEENEQKELTKALKRNANDNQPLFMDLKTGWQPGADEITDTEVIDAICSVPCHY